MHISHSICPGTIGASASVRRRRRRPLRSVDLGDQGQLPLLGPGGAALRAVLASGALAGLTELQLSRGGLCGPLPGLPEGLRELDLGDNPRLQLAPALGPRLERLRLNNCGLTAFDAGAGGESLECLDLSFNPGLLVTRLPPALKELRLAGCGLAALPDAVLSPALTGLTDLRVGRNEGIRVDAVPAAVTTLALDSCALAELPPLGAVATLYADCNPRLRRWPEPTTALTALVVARCPGLIETPAPSYPALETLMVAGVPGFVPANVQPALARLDASDCRLEGELPAGTLPALRELSADGARGLALGSLAACCPLLERASLTKSTALVLPAPDDGGVDLAALRSIDLRHSSLALPPSGAGVTEWLACAPALESVVLMGAGLGRARPHALRAPRSLRRLDASNLQLTMLRVTRASGLESLRLAQSRLGEVPALRGMTALRELALDRVDLQSAIDGVCLATGLETLVVRECGLAALPRALRQLTALTALDLSGNQGLDVGKALRLPRLRSLSLHDCGLADVGLGRLTALESLDLSDNADVAIRGLTRLGALRELSLAACGVDSLPAGGRHWPRLRTLDVTHNPRLSLAEFASPPPPALEHVACDGGFAVPPSLAGLRGAVVRDTAPMAVGTMRDYKMVNYLHGSRY